MKEFSTEFFQIVVDERLQFFIDDVDEELKTSTLYFTREKVIRSDIDTSMVGSVEVIAGVGDYVREALFQSVGAEALAMEGHISEAEIVDGKMTFSSFFDFQEDEFRQSHVLIDTDGSFSLYLKFLQGHSDLDMTEIENAFTHAKIFNSEVRQAEGTFLPMQFTDDQVEFRIGIRHLLKSISG